MPYYRDLREYLQVLEREGQLVRVRQEVNKDTEVHPLVRLQFRGLAREQRKGFLFERVTDARGRRFDMPYAVGVYAASQAIYALGMQCRPDQIFDKWLEAQSHPIEPVVVDAGPCQERAIEGDELRQRGLDLLPLPLSTPGFDTAPFATAANFVTRDPETGDYNVGNYRGQIKAPDRMGVMCSGPYQGLARHWEKYRAAGQDMPVAITMGVTPNVAYVGCARVEHGLNEYAVAGALAGEAVELVRCKTVDLLVPATSEIVIEGLIPTTELEREGPFGEFPGYMAPADMCRFVNVQRITSRRDPICVGFISQFPPSESTVLRGTAFEGNIRKKLSDAGFRNVLDVAIHESSGCWGYTVIKIDKQLPDEAQAIFNVMQEGILQGKVLVVVDQDIDARDADSVNWALTFRMQPHRDLRIVDGMRLGLDPSIVPPGMESSARNAGQQGERATALFIDATMPWPYPPTSLPRRELMEHARELWDELGLPMLGQLKEPWFGYELGYSDTRALEEADLALHGEHFEVGRRAAAERQRL